MTADACTAIWTLALAVVTLATLAATLMITRRDRRDADQRLLEEREQAEERVAGERKHERVRGQATTERSSYGIPPTLTDHY